MHFLELLGKLRNVGRDGVSLEGLGVDALGESSGDAKMFILLSGELPGELP